MNEKRAQFFLQQAVAYNKKGDKRNAVFAMKRYKMHQGQVEKLNGMQENLLRQIDALTSVAQNKDYLEALRQGATVQKVLQKDVNVEVRHYGSSHASAGNSSAFRRSARSINLLADAGDGLLPGFHCAEMSMPLMLSLVGSCCAHIVLA